MDRRDNAIKRQMLMGYDEQTGQPYALGFHAFRRGMTVSGPIGSGKTTQLLRFMMTFGLMHNILHLDFSGTGASLYHRFIANLTALLAVAGQHAPIVRRFARSLLERHAFGVLHSGAGPMPIRFDLLKRRRLANGEFETIAQVVDRVMLVLDQKLNTLTPQGRVLYRRICPTLLAALVAARRPISEAIKLLDDRVFAAFVFGQIEVATFSAHDTMYLRPQLQKLRRTLALYDPQKPGTQRAFMDETNSTRNALDLFQEGTVLGRFLGSDETFHPEDVAFGHQSLSLSATITDATLKAQAFQAVHGMFEALFASRGHAAGTFAPVTVVTDEIHWLPLHIAQVLAMTRNLNVSYALGFQNRQQWEDLGLKTMPDQLPSLMELAVNMRPSTMEEAEDEVLHTHWIRPGEAVQHFLAKSQNSSEGVSSTVSRAVAETLGEMSSVSWGNTRSHGTSESESESESDSQFTSESNGTSSSRGGGAQRGRSNGISENEFTSASENESAGSFESDGWGTNDSCGTSVLFGPDGEPHFSERDGMGSSGHSAVGHSDGVSWGNVQGTGSGRSSGESMGESEFASDGESQQFGSGQGSSRGTARGKSKSEAYAETDSQTLGQSKSTSESHGTATGESRQTGEALTEVLHILPCREQLFPLAQQALRRPRLHGNLRYEGSGVVLRFAPAIEYPEELCGVPIVAQFQAAQRAFFEGRAVPRLAYDPRVLLVGSRPAPIPPAAASAPEPSTPVAAETTPFTPGAPTPAPTVPKRPIARGRADRNRR